MSSAATLPSEAPRTAIACLRVAIVDGASALIGCRAGDPLKLIPACPRGPAVLTYQATYGGGLVAGDQVDLAVEVGAAARLCLATQASTKVYRSDDGRWASNRLRAHVAADALFAVLPDPVAPFAGARFRQDIAVDLAPSASLVLLDGYTAGRCARAERWALAGWDARLVVRRTGKPIAAERVWLDPTHGALAPRLGDAGCCTTLILTGPLVAEVARTVATLSAALPLTGGAVSAACSPLGADGCVLRLAADSADDAARFLRPALAGLFALLAFDPWQGR